MKRNGITPPDPDDDPVQWAVWTILSMAGDADYTICEDGFPAKLPVPVEHAIYACKNLMVNVDPKIIDEVASQWRRYISS